MGATNVIREIRKATRRKFSAEEKIRIVVEGLMIINTSELCYLPRSCKYRGAEKLVI